MSVDVPHVFDVIHVESVIDMQEVVRNRVHSDVFISAAAVSDFRPAKDGAINKISSSEDLILKLESTPKIINEVKNKSQNISGGL